MRNLLKDIDPRGLIFESYRIEGITQAECRSIFLDWALFEDNIIPQNERISILLDHYGPLFEHHPMSDVLKSALEKAPEPKRRGGRRGRVQNEDGQIKS